MLSACATRSHRLPCVLVASGGGSSLVPVRGDRGGSAAGQTAGDAAPRRRRRDHGEGGVQGAAGRAQQGDRLLPAHGADYRRHLGLPEPAGGAQENPAESPGARGGQQEQAHHGPEGQNCE